MAPTHVLTRTARLPHGIESYEDQCAVDISGSVAAESSFGCLAFACRRYLVSCRSLHICRLPELSKFIADPVANMLLPCPSVTCGLLCAVHRLVPVYKSLLSDQWRFVTFVTCRGFNRACGRSFVCLPQSCACASVTLRNTFSHSSRRSTSYFPSAPLIILYRSSTLEERHGYARSSARCRRGQDA